MKAKMPKNSIFFVSCLMLKFKASLKENFKKSLIFFALTSLCACSLAPSPQLNPTSYLIKANETVILKNIKPSQKSIKIAPIQAPLYLKSKDISYIKDNELGAYTKHMWKQSPVNLVSTMLTTKLEKNKLFKAVLNNNSQVVADFVLESRLDAFEQVFEGDKVYVYIALSASLIKGKTLLNSRHFSYKIHLKAIEPDLAIAGFDEGLNLLADELISWLFSLER